jgi:hypothetical protein
LPFEFVRKGVEGREGLFAVYNNWDKRDLNERYDTSRIAFINPFNPSKVVNEISKCEGVTIEEKFKNYKGQVFWFSKEGYNYPLSPIDPVLEDAQTTYQIKLFKNKNIRTNFMSSHMFVHKGGFEDDIQREEFKQSLEKFQGAEMVGNIMLVEVDQVEQVPQLLPFTIQNNDKLWEFTEQSTINNIVQNYLIPPVLVGVLQAGKLGTANEINDAHSFYNNHTSYDRLVVSEEFTKLLNQPIDLLPKSSIITIQPTQ